MHSGIALLTFFHCFFFSPSHAIPDRKCFNDFPSGKFFPVYVSTEIKFRDWWALEDFLPSCIIDIHTHSQKLYNLLDTITSHRLNTEISVILSPLDWHRDTDDSCRTVDPIPNHTHGSTTSETSWIILCLRGHMSLQKKPSLISFAITILSFPSKKWNKKHQCHISQRERTPENSPVGLNLMHSLSVDFLFCILHWHDEQNSDCVFKVEWWEIKVYGYI